MRTFTFHFKFLQVRFLLGNLLFSNLTIRLKPLFPSGQEASFVIAVWQSMLCVGLDAFIQLPLNGRWGGFQMLATAHAAAVNVLCSYIFVHVCINI